jgi:Zn-dependent protease with chaperone function
MTTPPRAEPLAIPSSTGLRMVVVAVALVVSGLFVGTGLHNALSETWASTVLGCISAEPSDIEAQLRCQAPAEQARAGAAIAAAAVAVLLAVGVVLLAPAVVRRRKRLVLADARFTPALDAVARLAGAEGLRVPGVLLGPAALREPFCVGRPGDYRIALPRKLALLGNPPLFHALVRHELAHLTHHDVALSWLARSLWYVLGPLLAVPVIVTLVRGEPLLAIDILWRSAVLIAVVLLVVRSLLRAREYDADLRAARFADVRQVLDVELARQAVRVRGWRAWLAWHPEAASRRAVLRDPVSAAAMGWTDGLTLGFLVALALPIVTGLASAAFFGLRVAGLPALTGALVVGPLFGAAIGIGLWRHAVLARPGGRRGSTRLVALGVLAGGVLGELASLAGVGLGAAEPPVAVPIALAGATVLIGGLGELWADRPRRAALVRWAAIGFGAVPATAFLWVAQQAQLAVTGSGWVLLTTWLTTPGALWIPGIAAVVLAVAAGWTAGARRTVLVGLVAGVGGGVGLAAYRFTAGPATSDIDALQRFSAVLLGAALVGAAVTMLLGLTRGLAGIGAGLLAGPVAAATIGITFLAVNTALGGDPLVIGGLVLGGAVAAGFALTAPAALLGLPRLPQLRSIAAVAALAAVVAGLTTAGVTAEREHIVPGIASSVPGPLDPNQPSLQFPVPRDLYPTVVALDLIERRIAETSAFGDLEAENPPAAAAAERIRREILPLASDILRTAQAVPLDDPDLVEIHGHALAAATAHVDAYELFAVALEQGDPARFQQAQNLLVAGDREWEAWAVGVQTL